MTQKLKRMRELHKKGRKGELRGWERAELDDLVYASLAPIRILLFPVMLLVKLYKWTYADREGFV